MNKTWIPYPTSWINSIEWHELTPRARVLLFCVWARTKTGEIPSEPKALRILAGLPDRPKRIAEAFAELQKAGFVEQDGTSFFLVQWRQIFAKFRPRNGQKRAKNLHTNQTISKGSANPSRARAFPPKGEKKGKEEEGTNARGDRSSFSSQLDPRIFEIVGFDK